MKLLLVLPLVAVLVEGFAPSTTLPRRSTALNNYESTVTEERLNHKLEQIAHKIRLQAYDVTTGVYGFESKDPSMGIENVRIKIPVDPSLGLELTEVAHAAAEGDERGLVLVSKVSGDSAEHARVHVGDTIVGVFCEGADFKESVTGLDYEATMDVLTRAKTHAHLMEGGDGATVDLELNRLVPRTKVQVIVEGAQDKPIFIDALAGDNLRLLLMHHGIDIYNKRLHRLDQPSVAGVDCGGEGICGTCMVKILEGEESLNQPGPKETEIMTKRPMEWRGACQTIVGADNKEGTIRVRIHPEWSKDGKD